MAGDDPDLDITSHEHAARAAGEGVSKAAVVSEIVSEWSHREDLLAGPLARRTDVANDMAETETKACSEQHSYIDAYVTKSNGDSIDR